MKKSISCYCQNCQAANKVADTHCRRCGTRLLLVVFPQSLKFDTNYAPSYYEDHLLERVSLLELRLAQATEQLAMAFEFIKQETKITQRIHRQIIALFETIKTYNPDLADILDENLRELNGGKVEKNADKKHTTFSHIINRHDAEQSELFAHLVKEGIRLLADNEEKQAFQNLERAALLSPNNVALFFYVAENFFRTDNFPAAQKYLAKILEIAPQHEQTLLLSGVICADAGNADEARRLLSFLVNHDEMRFCVNYVWAMLAAYENNWTESLAAFKQAAEKIESAETNYLIGCVSYQLGRMKDALGYLQKAVALDIKFADAWFMQSVVYDKLKNSESAKNTRDAALEAMEAGAQCYEFMKRKKTENPATALPFLHLEKSKNLLTKGSRRLNNFFREKIYRIIE